MDIVRFKIVRLFEKICQRGLFLIGLLKFEFEPIKGSRWILSATQCNGWVGGDLFKIKPDQIQLGRFSKTNF